MPKNGYRWRGEGLVVRLRSISKALIVVACIRKLFMILNAVLKPGTKRDANRRIRTSLEDLQMKNAAVQIALPERRLALGR